MIPVHKAVRGALVNCLVNTNYFVLSKSGKKFSVTNAFELMTDNKNRNAKVQCALFKGITRD